jgi:sarcosine oxidase gamma subunit
MKPDATLAQIMSAAKVLKRDMHNRKAAVSEQLAQMRARISGKPAATEGAAPALHPGEVLMLDTKGKKHAVAEKDVKAAEEHQWKRATP